MLLPDTLHELLDVALKDIDEVYKDPGYEVDMGRWHQTGADGVCYVCFAGAVIAKTLKVDKSVHITQPDYHWGDDVAHKLYALDKLSEFNVIDAWGWMDGSLRNAPDKAYDLHERYSSFPFRFNDTKSWYDTMHSLKDELKKAGM